VRLRDRLIDPRSPDQRPRRAAYALPTLFTAGGLFLGFFAILKVFEGALATARNVADAGHHFQQAAMAIGGAAFFDALDGRIARMTNTVSEFGRELDSLADVIAFGIAPAALAFAWGVYFVPRIGAAGAVQYPKESGAEKSGTRGPEIFRRPADSRRRRDAGRRGLRNRRDSADVMGTFGRVSGADRPAGVPDGQHVAISQFQGSEPDAAPLDFDPGGAGQFDFFDFLRVPAAAAGDDGGLRRQRDRDSYWRHHPAALPTGAAGTGAPGWLNTLNRTWWRSSAATHY
jgi:hypothetical protein